MNGMTNKMELKALFGKPSSQDEGPSHTDFTGGKLYVKSSSLSELFRILITAHNNREKMFINEIRTPVSRLYVDIDVINHQTEINWDIVMELVLWHNRVIRQVFDMDNSQSAIPRGKCEDGLRVAVLARPSTPKGAKFKHGIHLVWTHIFTDVRQATSIRAMVVDQLQGLQGNTYMDEFRDGENWATIVDEAVIKNGLRLPLSHKYNKTTKRSEGGCYELRKVYVRTSENGVKEHTPSFNRLKPLTFMFTRCCIRTESECTKGFQEHLVPHFINQYHLQRSDVQEVKFSDQRFLNIRNAVKGFSREYRHIEIKSIKYDDPSKRYIINIKGMGQHYCLNVKRPHSSNSIYFEIDMQGVRQRCFSKKRCKMFRSEYRQFDDFDKLFPNANAPDTRNYTTLYTEFMATLNGKPHAWGNPIELPSEVAVAPDEALRVKKKQMMLTRLETMERDIDNFFEMLDPTVQEKIVEPKSRKTVREKSNLGDNRGKRRKTKSLL